MPARRYARYTPEFRQALLAEVERVKPSYEDLIAILRVKGVPRSTFQTWWTRHKSGMKPRRGRPPAGFREAVREEISRGLKAYFGDPPADKGA